MSQKNKESKLRDLLYEAVRKLMNLGGWRFFDRAKLYQESSSTIHWPLTKEVVLRINPCTRETTLIGKDCGRPITTAELKTAAMAINCFTKLVIGWKNEGYTSAMPNLDIDELQISTVCSAVVK